MNKKFLSAILFGALMVSSTGTFVSCKDYDDEIDEINATLTDLKSQLAALQTKVENGDYVTGITKTADGKGMTFTFSKGSTVTVTLDVKDGEAGAPGTPGKDAQQVTVDEKTGELKIDGKGTGIFPAKDAAKAPVKAEGGYWYTLNEKGEYENINIPVSGITVTGTEATGYTLTVYSADGEKVIKLPTASSTITEIMIGDLTFGAVTTTSSATGLDWGYKSNGKIDWKGPKGNIAANQLMIGQIAPAEGLLSVTPASVDLSGMTLELIDTKGDIAPVNIVATPNSTDGAATAPRAAATNGKWNLAITLKSDVTKDNITKVFGAWDNSTYNAKLYALRINGKVYTDYTIAVKVAKDNAITNATTVGNGITLSTTNLKSIGNNHNKALDNNSNIEVPVGSSSLVCSDSKFYDGYIAFEGTQTAKAEKLGVSANGMNLSIKESAKAEEVIATVHIMSVDGKETTKNITLKIGGVKSDDTQTIAATTYELGLDDSGDLNAIVVDLKDAFSSLSAANAEEINKLTQITVENVKDQVNFLANDLTSTNVTFYTDKDGKPADKFVDGSANNGEVVLANSDARNIRWMKIAVNGNVNAKAKPGNYNLTLTIKDQKSGTAVSTIKTVTIPVTVALPAWDKLFKNTTAWEDGKFVARLTASVANTPVVNFTRAFLPNTKAAVNDIKLAIDKVDNKDVIANQSSASVTLQNIQNTNKTLKVNELGVVASYTFGGVNDLTVKSSKFTTKIMSIFEGAKLVYYTNNVAGATAKVGADFTIAKLTTANNKKNGLALQYGKGESAVCNSIPAIEGVTVQESNSTAADKVKVAYGVDGLNNVTAVSDSEGIKLVSTQIGDKGTLVLTFTDFAGIVTTATIAFE